MSHLCLNLAKPSQIGPIFYMKANLQSADKVKQKKLESAIWK